VLCLTPLSSSMDTGAKAVGPAGEFLQWLGGSASPKGQPATNAPAEQRELGVFCDMYEVCKCKSGADEASAVCLAGTCGYAPSAPSKICCQGFWCDDPDCKATGVWEDCEWANFNEGIGWDFPGQGSYIDIPPVRAVTPDLVSQGLLVFTDVDDTLICSGGGPAGVDEECQGTQPHEMYPGVAEFALALARGPTNYRTPPKVVPLSARPSELKHFLAMDEDSEVGRSFTSVGARAGVEAWGLDAANAQYGSVFDVTDFIERVGGSDTDLTRFDKLGYRKYKNWAAALPHLLMPTAFIGDNGQGDTVAAQMMMLRSSGLTPQGGAMLAAFIHDVLRKCPSGSGDCRESWERLGIDFFDDYPEAAGQALRRGLISPESCQTVCSAAPTLKCHCG